MKRKKIALVIALFFSFFLTACTQKASNPNQDNWSKYQKQGSITIGFDNTFVPMGFEEKNGQYAGFDIDLAQAVSEKLGIQIKFQPIDWDMTYIFYVFYNKPILGAGLGCLSIIKELYSFLGFSATIMYNGQRGKQYKWFNYLFYPVHLLILGILRFYLDI